MDAAKPFLTGQDIAKLSDEELVRLYCANRQDEYPVSVLFTRHQQTFRNQVRGLIRGNFHPPGWTPQDFADAVFTRALVYLAQRLCQFLEYSIPFPNFLRYIARSAVFDEYDYLKKTIELSDGSIDGSELRRSEDEGSRRGPFRSRVFQERWWLKSFVPHPERGIIAEERKDVVLRLLVLHAQQSAEDLACSSSIRLRYWDDWPLAKCGARIYGLPFSDREKNRQEKAISRLLVDNYRKMRGLLKEHFGVTAFRQI